MQPSKMRDVRKVGSSVNGLGKSRSSSNAGYSLYLYGILSLIAVFIIMFASGAIAQQSHPQHSDGFAIQGHVINLAGKPVGDASVRLEQKGALEFLETKTNAAGIFEFTGLAAGDYLLSAKKSGLSSHDTSVLALAEGDQKHVDLILEAPVDLKNALSPSPSQAMEFSDKPNFTIAGVTDWTAVGGHGSDSILRTSEDLARETLSLKPEGLRYIGSSLPGGENDGVESERKLRASLARSPGSFEGNHQLGEFYLHAGRYLDAIPLLQAAYQINPAMIGNAHDLAMAYKEAGEFSQAREQVQRLLEHNDTADLHHLLGEIDEKLNDPLAAVHEDEQAVRLNPSEQNYFEWGSELLLHRAVWQAVEVLRNGAKVYPKSSRMLTGLGTALFAGALYDQAALRLCEASDLNPTDVAPYIFMGKIEIAAPAPLPCVEQKLEQFVKKQPQNSLANYFYAMAILKRQKQPADRGALEEAETLLVKAVKNDPHCVEAYLQLGILYSSQQNYEKAIDFYTRAIEVNPQSGEAHYRLGVAYDRTAQPAKASREFLLHDEIEKQQADAIDLQRREIKQFLIVLQGQSLDPRAQ